MMLLPIAPLSGAATMPLSTFERHLHPVLRPERDEGCDLDPLAGDEREAIAPGNRRDDQLRLHKCKGVADAEVRAATEGEVREARAGRCLLWPEPLRVETLRVRPAVRAAMGHVRAHHDERVRGD